MSDWADTAKLRQEISDAWHLADIRKAEAEQLRAELARVTAQRDAILMQARIWSGEAKAQKATVDSVGEILGGVPDWGPIAQGVEQLRAELAASREREARMRDAVAWLERRLFDRNWGGTLGAPCDWYMAIGYRHTLQKMKGASLLEAVEFAALAEGAQG